MKVAPILTLILLGNTLDAQVFTEVPAAQLPFAPVYWSAIAFADIDGDGDEDVLITGMIDLQTPVTELYTNDGSGGYTLVLGTPFTPVGFSAVAFADMDGDGDQDVLIAGSLVSNDPFVTLSFIGSYANDGAGNFSLVDDTPFIGVGRGTIDFADVDGDGDQDVLITGKPSGGLIPTNIANLFINDGSGIFTMAPGTPFHGVDESAADLADVDGDGDVDALITGFGPAGLLAELFLNDGSGGFTQVGGMPFTPVRYGSVAFADIDGDGDQDVMLTGSINDYGPTGDKVAELFVNDGTGAFTLVSGTSFPACSSTALAFNDVDGDGDQDLLITGFEFFKFTDLFVNDGAGNFTVIGGSDFTPSAVGSLVFADVDGDSDSDVIISGSYSVVDTRLYLNGAAQNSVEEGGRLEFVFTLYPNPSGEDRVSISYTSEVRGMLDVRILDVSGRLISRLQQPWPGGARTFSLDISSLAKGSYVVQINDGRRTGTQPLVVR